MQKTETLPDRLDGANSTLLLSSSFSDGENCAELLRPSAADDTNVLWVSYTKSPDQQLRRWRAHTDDRPAEMGMVSVEDSTRSVAADAGGDGGPSLPGPNAPIETVNSPNDLTGLGIRITEFLSDWADNDNRTVVCFDSLTALLQYVELDTAYEFLHIITGRMASAGAFAHFHMDPDAHDEQTVEIVTSLMDAVVEVDEDGEQTIRSRKA
ncbi:DUF7504 family protein [Halolamina salifodinae]|uniref:KaiC-like domain-containing protein n=1 Tax=Halolamina salifodinae TaxID=1202767 RepID=A0A8T4H0T5_9EURY|nr:hypothetical protein [Halolamina salifodinae]MBP1987973.1 hypothetical protein [Halolamina salifodinae]